MGGCSIYLLISLYDHVQDDIIVSDKVEGLEPGTVHEINEVRSNATGLELKGA